VSAAVCASVHGPVLLLGVLIVGNHSGRPVSQRIKAAWLSHPKTPIVNHRIYLSVRPFGTNFDMLTHKSVSISSVEQPAALLPPKYGVYRYAAAGPAN
jgi:hypothetical protein